MARYVDADKLIKKIYPMGIGDGMYTINAKAVKFAIDNTPTADVAPKSEVEQLQKQLKEFDGFDVVPRSEAKERILIAQKEVAREIFEEFRTEMRSRLNSCNELYKNDPDDYYGGQTWAYSAAIFVLENIIKKHTEGTE